MYPKLPVNIFLSSVSCLFKSSRVLIFGHPITEPPGIMDLIILLIGILTLSCLGYVIYKFNADQESTDNPQKRQEEIKRQEERKRQKELAEKCKGQEYSLESYERRRYRDLGIQSFYDGPNAQYLGDCIYEVGSNFFDWKLEGQFDIYIKYRYMPQSDSWKRISSEAYKAIGGQWVRQ